MAMLRDRAIVVARVDYSETSQVIVLFTREHGKVRAIAKGIKRGTKTRFAAGADLLDVGEIVVSVRDERAAGLATLTEWKQTRSFIGLREKLFRIYAGQYAAEITASLTEDWDPHAALYDAAVALLETLNRADEPLEPIITYQLAVLTEIGSLPRFDTCVACGRATDLTHFSSLEGGMICLHCEPGRVEKREVSAGTLAVLRSRRGTGDNVVRRRRSGSSSGGGHPLVGPFDVLDYHIAHLMGRPPKLADKLVPPYVRRRLG